MRGRFAGFAVMVLSLGVSAAVPAQATTVLDQVSVNIDQVNFGAVESSPPTFGRAQTFTAGITGWLAAIEVWSSLRDTRLVTALRLDLLDVVSGLPVGGLTGAADDPSVLASVNGSAQVDAYSIFRLVRFDFRASGVWMEAGDQLAFMTFLQAPGFIGDTDAYSGGTSYSFNTLFDRPDWSNPGGDLAFRTYMEPAPVPLPASALLLAGGLVVLAGLRRRRQSR